MHANSVNNRSIDFAAYVAGITQSKLTGLFVERVLHEHAAKLKTPFAMPFVETITAGDEEKAMYDSRQIAQNIRQFEDACIKRDVCFLTEIAKGNETDIIIEESRFADIIIVSADTSFQPGVQQGIPTNFVKKLLNESECPVIVAPESFDEIDEIVFACDNSRSSVHAIKQFTYLFPQLSSVKLTALYVKQDDEQAQADRRIITWLKMHYAQVHEETLTGQPSDELFGRLLFRRNKFIVMGSFGRALFSLALKPSTAALLLKTVNLPIFIAHT